MDPGFGEARARGSQWVELLESIRYASQPSERRPTLPLYPTERRVPEWRRSNGASGKSPSGFPPKMLAHFKNLHVQHSDWAAANSQPGFASLGDFLGDVLDGYPALCAAYDEALESIKRQGADLVFLAAALKAAGGEEYQVVSIDEARLSRAGPKGERLN